MTAAVLALLVAAAPPQTSMLQPGQAVICQGELVLSSDRHIGLCSPAQCIADQSGALVCAVAKPVYPEAPKPAPKDAPKPEASKPAAAKGK
jgi:hypothetical protein